MLRRLSLQLLRSLLLRLLLLLHLPPKHLLLPLVQLSQAEPLRANLHVMRLARLLVRLHHDPTHLVPIRRVRLLVERLAQRPLVAPLARRLVAR